MARSREIKLAAGVLTAMLLSACGSSNNSELPLPPEPPAPPAQISFTGFVKGQFSQTADDTDPVDVESQNLTFTDDTNPAAYDDLLDPQ